MRVSEHRDESAVCQASIRYTPTDRETGRPYPERHVHCTAPEGHTGYHKGDDGMPFGPWLDPSTSPGKQTTATPGSDA